jgi:hypothetical protein
MTASLLVVADREPLTWLLREQRFAIPVARATSASREERNSSITQLADATDIHGETDAS